MAAACSASCPAAAATTSGARPGHPLGRRRGVRGAGARRRAPARPRRRRRPPVHRDRHRRASTPTPTGSPTRPGCSRATSSTPTGPCARSPRGSRRASSSSSTAETVTFTGYTVAAANSKAYGGGMFVAPDAELDDGLLDVVVTVDGSRASLARASRRSSRASTSNNPGYDVFRARSLRVSRRPARSRSTRTATRSRSSR